MYPPEISVTQLILFIAGITLTVLVVVISFAFVFYRWRRREDQKFETFRQIVEEGGEPPELAEAKARDARVMAAAARRKAKLEAGEKGSSNGKSE